MAKPTGSGETPKFTPKPDATPKAAKGAGGAVSDGCTCQGCSASTRLPCSEHYDHYKFGLINKVGQQVADYEKKFEHYMRHKQSHSTRKVA